MKTSVSPTIKTGNVVRDGEERALERILEQDQERREQYLNRLDLHLARGNWIMAHKVIDEYERLMTIDADHEKLIGFGTSVGQLFEVRLSNALENSGYLTAGAAAAAEVHESSYAPWIWSQSSQ